VLVVRAVVDAGREDHDHRFVHPARRRGRQRREKPAWVVDHGAHAHTREELREGLRHRAAVGDHVGDAAGHAHVVLEHAPASGRVSDHVDARDVDPHAVRRVDAPGRPVEVRGGDDQCPRQDAVGHHPLARVDVLEERLEGADPLRDAGGKVVPLGAVEHAGDGVQREGALDAADVERHPLGQVRTGQGIGPGAQLARGELPHRVVDVLVGAPDRAVDVEHLVPRLPQRVPLEDVGGHGAERNPCV